MEADRAKEANNTGDRQPGKWRRNWANGDWANWKIQKREAGKTGKADQVEEKSKSPEKAKGGAHNTDAMK